METRSRPENTTNSTHATLHEENISIMPAPKIMDETWIIFPNMTPEGGLRPCASPLTFSTQLETEAELLAILFQGAYETLPACGLKSL